MLALFRVSPMMRVVIMAVFRMVMMRVIVVSVMIMVMLPLNWMFMSLLIFLYYSY